MNKDSMCIRTYRTVELNKGLQHRSRYGRRREYQAAHTSRVYKNVFTIYIYVNVAHFYRCTLNSRTHVRTHARTLPATRRTSAPLAKSPYVVTFTIRQLFDSWNNQKVYVRTRAKKIGATVYSLLSRNNIYVR